MKTILVPTDFSEQAKFAFDFALQMAHKLKGEIYLLHVADLPVVSDPMGTNLHAFLSPETLKSLEDKIDSKLQDFESVNTKGVKVHRSMEWGNPFSAITKNITDSNCDMVVMGSKGASGLKEIFIGSNAERIIRHSKVPVITIKEKTEISSIKSIVFGTDIKEINKVLFKNLKELVEFFDATLHLVHVNTPTDFKRDTEVIPALKNLAKNYFPDGTMVHVYNDVNEDLGLIHFTESINADLIALGTHGKRGFEHFISGSVAEDVANHAKRPIWTSVLNK